MEKIIEIIREFWLVLGEMSPYLLLGFLIAGILHVYIPSDLIFKHLGQKGFLSSLKAAILGIPLPLCSCGVIPVAASLRKNRASREATTSFLIATPQTGVDSILVTLSLLGPVFAIFRPFAALISGILGGWFVGLFPSGEIVERKIEEQCACGCCCDDDCDDAGHNHKKNKSKFMAIVRYGFVMLPRDIGKSLIYGLIIAAGIAAFVPENFFVNLHLKGFHMMLIMMVVGIPLYVCATASVPIAAMLIAKGVSPGAALVFLMTGPATNAATIAVIANTMGRMTSISYLAAVAITALGSGFILDAIFTSQNTTAAPFMPWMIPQWFNATCSILLIGMLVYSMTRLSKKAI